MDITKKTLGKNIALFRDRSKLTQAELAEKSDISLRMLQRLEYGETFAGPKTLQSLAKALNVSSSDLFMSKDQAAFRGLSEGAEILLKLSTLPDGVKRLALAITLGETSFLDGLPPKTIRLFSQLLESLGAKPLP